MTKSILISPLMVFSVSVFAMPFCSFAMPAEGVVKVGEATINITSPQKMDITQSTDKALIEWGSFDINKTEHIQFHQPSSSSFTLNRIMDYKASDIDGKITANGNLAIINKYGVRFGENSVIDVNSLVVTSADISDQNFLSGKKLNFDQAGAPDAAIINNGSITAKEAGLVGLVAPHVENHGIIKAKLGKVQLSSGDTFTIDFYGDRLMEVAVSDQVKSQIVVNTGTIESEGGEILITAAAGKEIIDNLIRVEGVLKAPTAKQVNGKIIIGPATSKDKPAAKTAPKKTIVEVKNATIEAAGLNPGESGGKIEITADKIAVDNGSKLDVSGQADGGVVHVGGQYKGAEGTPTSSEVFLAKDVTISASSQAQGNGGEVILWSDKHLIFRGTIEARGGRREGNGGFVETSSKGYFDVMSGSVNTLADNGKTGTWLLDPENLIIDANITGGDWFENKLDYPGYIKMYPTQHTDNYITPSDVGEELAQNNIVINADNIVVSSPITFTDQSGHYLTLSANDSININATIDLSGSNIPNFSLTAINSINITFNNNFQTVSVPHDCSMTATNGSITIKADGSDANLTVVGNLTMNAGNEILLDSITSNKKNMAGYNGLRLEVGAGSGAGNAVITAPKVNFHNEPPSYGGGESFQAVSLSVATSNFDMSSGSVIKLQGEENLKINSSGDLNVKGVNFYNTIDNNLVLSAQGSINVSGNINLYGSSTGGDLIIMATNIPIWGDANWAEGNINLTNATITTNGGNVLMGGSYCQADYCTGAIQITGVDLSTSPLTPAQGYVYGNISVNNSTINAGGGNIVMNGMLTNDTGSMTAIDLKTAHLTTTSSGKVKLSMMYNNQSSEWLTLGDTYGINIASTSAISAGGDVMVYAPVIFDHAYKSLTKVAAISVNTSLLSSTSGNIYLTGKLSGGGLPYNHQFNPGGYTKASDVRAIDIAAASALNLSKNNNIVLNGDPTGLESSSIRYAISIDNSTVQVGTSDDSSGTGAINFNSNGKISLTNIPAVQNYVGDIDFVTSSLNIDSSDSVSAPKGKVNINEYSNGSIAIGNTDAGGVGDLFISAATLNKINAKYLNIGNNGAQSLYITDVINLTGITDTLTLVSKGAVYNSGLTTHQNPINMTNGRWLIYEKPAGNFDALDLKDDLTGSYGQKRRYSCNYVSGNFSCNGAIPTGVNVWLYHKEIRPFTAKLSGVPKVYDAKTDATVGVYTTTSGDIVSLSSNTGHFADKNVGGSKSITVDNAVLSTSDDSVNYTLDTSGATANITPATLTITELSNPSKTYDGTKSATFTSGALSGVYTGDKVQLKSAISGTFANKIVGNDKVVTLTSLAGTDNLTGDDAANYALEQPTDVTGNITQRPLNVDVSSATVASKPYDATTNAVISGGKLLSATEASTSYTPISSDSVSLSTVTPNGIFSSPYVGTEIPVTGNYSLVGADANNYSLNQPTGLTGNINPKPITINLATSASNKIYDGTKDAKIDGYSIASGVIGSDSVNIAGYTAKFSTSDVKYVDSKPQKMTVFAHSYVLDNNNYSISNNRDGDSPQELSAEIIPRPINVIAYIGEKNYDGNTNVNISGFSFADDQGRNNLIDPGDLNSTSVSGVTFINASASSHPKGIVTTGATVHLAGFNVANYYITSHGFNTDDAFINPLTVQVSGVIAHNKIYDALPDTTLDLSKVKLDGIIDSERGNVTFFAPKGRFDNVNAANNIQVKIINPSLSSTNYQLPNGNLYTDNYANIAPRLLSVQDQSTSAQDKTYDTHRVAQVTGETLNTTNVVGSDDVNLVATGLFTDKNVAYDGSRNIVKKDITVTYGLSGRSAANYCLDNVSCNYASYGTITPSPIAPDPTITTLTKAAKINPATLTATLYVNNREYNGFTLADINRVDLGGKLGSDDVGVVTSIANFDGKDVAYDGQKNIIARTATTTVTSIVGNDSSNYILSNNNLTASAVIEPKQLGVIGLIAPDKIYDKNTVELLSGGELDGVVQGDEVSLDITSMQGEFNDYNVGENKPILVSGLKLRGNNANNYALPTINIFGNIKPKPLTIYGATTASSKTYDALTTTTVSGQAYDTNAVIAGDGPFSLTAIGNFFDKNVGVSKPLKGVTYNIDGTNIGNYVPHSIDSPLTASITPLMLTANVSLNDKVYDGTAVASNLVINPSNKFAGDDLKVTGSAQFPSPSVAKYDDIIVYNVVKSGNDAANYDLTNLTSHPITASASITAKALTIIGLSAQDKTYDGSPNTTVSGGSLSGIVSPDDVSFHPSDTGTFENANAGQHKTVNGLGFSLTGNSKGNYSLNTPVAYASINPKVLTVSGLLAQDKTYDGTTNAIVSLANITLDNVLNQDLGKVKVIGTTSGKFSDKTVGQTKTVTGLGFSLTGTASGNYNLNTPTTTASITAKKISLGTIAASNKEYDATTAAKITTANLLGVVSGDQVAPVASANFVDSVNVGINKPVLASFMLLGDDSGNYHLSPNTKSTVANIGRRTLTIAGVKVNNKIYDGTTAATINNAATNLVGVLPEDINNITFDSSKSSASFADIDAGTDKPVIISGFNVSVPSGSVDNYRLPEQPNYAKANIDPKPLEVAGVKVNRVFNGTNIARLSNQDAKLSGVVGSDQVVLNEDNAVGIFANFGPGSNIPVVDVIGYSIAGRDAHNYKILQPANLQGSILDLSSLNKVMQSSATISNITSSLIVNLSPSFVSNNLITTAPSSNFGYTSYAKATDNRKKNQDN